MEIARCQAVRRTFARETPQSLFITQQHTAVKEEMYHLLAKDVSLPASPLWKAWPSCQEVPQVARVDQRPSLAHCLFLWGSRARKMPCRLAVRTHHA